MSGETRTYGNPTYVSIYVAATVPQNWFSRLRKYLVDTHQQLLADFTEEPVDVEGRDPEGDQLAVKQ